MKRVTSAELKANPGAVLDMAKDESVTVVRPDGTDGIIIHALHREHIDGDCIRCNATMFSPEDNEEGTELCHDCVYVVLDEVRAQLARATELLTILDASGACKPKHGFVGEEFEVSVDAFLAVAK